jgi:phage baseplate assembly protein W
VDKGKLFGRGISFPPRVVDGRIAWSEGEVNVRESAGLGSFLFEPNTVTTRHLIADRIAKAVTQWEPRVVVEQVMVDPDPDDPHGAIATLTYKLVATQARERVQLNVTLAN